MKIEVENATKKFENNTVFENVSLTLDEGKVYGIIGRNGSGKSVLFKLICGFYRPTSGKIRVDGCDLNVDKKFIPDCRVLIEKPNFLPDLSGIDNLKLLASIQNKIEEKQIKETLDIVNLNEEDRNKKFHKYSLGMKQKLGIAQVLMENPSIMIFDEPFNGIEKETLNKLKSYFKNLDKSGKIILLASHVEEDIKEICDEVYKIEDGKIKKSAN